jgi:2-hydroxychromene-2-carboxylate isomerase
VDIARFWFDPICPWTYVTYQWLEEVRQVRQVTVEPRLLSLHFLNQGREDHPHRDTHLASLPLERFLAHVRAQRGAAAMEGAYRVIAEALFADRREPGVDLVVQAAAALLMDSAEAAAASADEAWDEVIRRDHREAMDLVGADVGSPVIALEGGAAFFGPVLARAPRGEDAGRVWDGCAALASHSDFYELKRSRGAGVQLRFD